MDEVKQELSPEQERFLYLTKRTKEVTNFYANFFVAGLSEDSEMIIKALEGVNQLSGAMFVITNIPLSKETLDAFELMLAHHEGVMMGYGEEEIPAE